MAESREDIARLEQKLDALSAQVQDLHRTQQMLASLYEDMVPVATTALHSASVRLAELEQKGYFDFAKESMHVLDEVVQGFSPDDVHALAENIVGILGAVKRATQPEVLAFAEHTADVLEGEAARKPKGIVSMLRQGTKDENVRRGLAVAFEALRQVGKAANPALRVRHRSFGAALAAHEVHAPAAPAAGAPEPAPAAASAPVAAATLAGLDLDAEGFLLTPEDWTEAFAEQAAAEAGVTLTQTHWDVLRFVRAEYFAAHGAPNIRRITVGAGIPTKDLFALFPRAPAKTAARLAGVKKPVGCI